jgi:hypothetical protein
VLDLEFLERIKTLAIVAMFSDDDLMERLVLKGGNALDIVYRVSTRASTDLDFSIDGDFDDFDVLRDKISRVLRLTFEGQGFVPFDFKIKEAPPVLSEDMKDFWGGYQVEFKLIERSRYEEFHGDIDALRPRALGVGKVKEEGKSPSSKFSIQLSKHEYCQGKRAHLLEGYTVYVYAPVAFVCEKIRAICQQMPEYVKTARSHPRARARDFVDIHAAAQAFAIDFVSGEFGRVLRQVFEAKRVPLWLIGQIHRYREYHREDFAAVRYTLKPNAHLREFDYYFDYVVDRCTLLEPLWNK